MTISNCRKIFYVYLVISMCACTGRHQFLVVETESSFKKHKKEFRKAIAIDPDIIWIEKVKDAESQLLQKEDREELIHALLEKNAALAGIDLQVISPLNLKADQVSYFNELLPLKEQILQSNFLQETSTKSKFRLFKPSYYKNSFKIAPILDSEYSWLAEEYGTPYFLFQGLIVRKEKVILQPNWRNLFFAIMVNVERGEIVYREIRGFETPPQSTHLNGIFYDSFNIIRRVR